MSLKEENKIYNQIMVGLNKSYHRSKEYEIPTVSKIDAPVHMDLSLKSISDKFEKADNFIEKVDSVVANIVSEIDKADIKTAVNQIQSKADIFLKRLDRTLNMELIIAHVLEEFRIKVSDFDCRSLKDKELALEGLKTLVLPLLEDDQSKKVINNVIDNKIANKEEEFNNALRSLDLIINRLKSF